MKGLLFFILILFLALTMSAQAEILRIEHRNNFYHIYNEKGREAKAVSDRIGTLVGHGSSFFIVRKNNFYMLHDEQGRLCKTLSTSIGDIIAVSGTTFTVRTKSGFVSVYNSKGEKVKQ